MQVLPMDNSPQKSKHDGGASEKITEHLSKPELMSPPPLSVKKWRKYG